MRTAARESDLIRAVGRIDQVARLQALLEVAEQVAGLGSLEYLPDEDRLIWSENMFRILGYEPGEVEPDTELAMSVVHPDDQARIRKNWEAWLGGRIDQRSDGYRIVRPDGSVRFLRTTMTAWEQDSEPRRLVAAVQDQTEQRQAEREIAAHASVSEALETWTSLDDGLRALLAGLADALGCACGVAWIPAGPVLRARVTWQAEGSAPDEFDTRQRAITYPSGSGLAGEAWESGKPTIATRDEPAENGPPGEPKLQAAVAIPAIHQGDVLAVFELHTAGRPELTDRLRRSMTGIGWEIGHFLGRRRGELEPPRLTPRETEILQLAAEGLSGPKIAERLTISQATVKTHFEHIYLKLGAPDRPAAVAEGLRLGILI